MAWRAYPSASASANGVAFGRVPRPTHSVAIATERIAAAEPLDERTCPTPDGLVATDPVVAPGAQPTTAATAAPDGLAAPQMRTVADAAARLAKAAFALEAGGHLAVAAYAVSARHRSKKKESLASEVAGRRAVSGARRARCRAVSGALVDHCGMNRSPASLDVRRAPCRQPATVDAGLRVSAFAAV